MWATWLGASTYLSAFFHEHRRISISGVVGVVFLFCDSRGKGNQSGRVNTPAAGCSIENALVLNGYVVRVGVVVLLWADDVWR